MNIKEVEEKTGLKKANIRYYEQEGLLTPKRNKQNNYREYDMEDVQTLERVKFLRLLGVSIEDIRRFQKKECTISDLMVRREKELHEEIKQAAELKSICQIVKNSDSGFDSLDLTQYDMKTIYFKKKGAKIMRLDKIRQLERISKTLIRIWQCAMLAYLPIYGALKLMGHTVPDVVQISYFIVAMITVVGEIYLRNKIQGYKDSVW